MSFWLFCTKPIPGYEGLYRVSAGGVVESCKSGAWRRMKLIRIRSTGYLHVNLHKDGEQAICQVHRLVLESHVGSRPEGFECRHLNGVRTDNRLSNLAWGTRTENAADRKLHGTDPQGERNGYAKLTETDVRHIRRLLADGWKQRDVGAKFGVTQALVSLIHRGKNWAHVPPEPTPEEAQRTSSRTEV